MILPDQKKIIANLREFNIILTKRTLPHPQTVLSSRTIYVSIFLCLRPLFRSKFRISSNSVRSIGIFLDVSTPGGLSGSILSGFGRLEVSVSMILKEGEMNTLQIHKDENMAQSRPSYGEKDMRACFNILSIQFLFILLIK